MSRAVLSRLRPPASLIRLPWSAAPWLAVGYLASYPLVGGALFAVSTAAAVSGVVLSQFTVTLPLIIGSVWVVRSCAQVERGRATLVDRPIPYRYSEVTEAGLPAHLVTRCTDPAFARDCAYLILLFPPLLILDLFALLVWLVSLGCVTLPLWYWAVEVSGGPMGPDGALGRLHTLPGAVVLAVVALALLPFAARLLLATARLHLTVAQAVLRPPRDPLAQAKGVLGGPGPLSTLPGARRAGALTEPTENGESHEPNTGRVI
ncbi:Putative sensor [Streptomyces sp. Ag82_O1-12]|uniref:sensor domain-containing protein n=1 Tax=unclassified Streptomyces TaxID=2593676 RepID=UPI000BC4229E|nr:MULTISPECIES: sensor domain-containing protein [unclassified Streptomyces]SMQ18919.1 Putative sensor [Streptomyces sp. Ag82_O1-12]SOD47959.1 Putative sensor [Streptomyces sp. Ag82_G6-1]